MRSIFGYHIKNNYVCCDCRERTRRGSFSAKGPHKQPLCPKCGRLMSGVGRHFRAPKKSDDKGWVEVRRWARAIRLQSGDPETRKRLARQHMFKNVRAGRGRRGGA